MSLFYLRKSERKKLYKKTNKKSLKMLEKYQEMAFYTS